MTPPLPTPFPSLPPHAKILSANGLCANPRPSIRFDARGGLNSVELPPELLPLARGLVLTRDHLDAAAGPGNTAAPLNLWQRVSDANERVAVHALLGRIGEVVKTYQTSVYDDERIYAEMQRGEGGGRGGKESRKALAAAVAGGGGDGPRTSAVKLKVKPGTESFERLRLAVVTRRGEKRALQATAEVLSRLVQ